MFCIVLHAVVKCTVQNSVCNVMVRMWIESCCSLFDLLMDFLLFYVPCSEKYFVKKFVHKSGRFFWVKIQFSFQWSYDVFSWLRSFFSVHHCHWWRNISDKNVSFQKLSIEIAQLRSLNWCVFDTKNTMNNQPKNKRYRPKCVTAFDFKICLTILRFQTVARVKERDEQRGIKRGNESDRIIEIQAI